LLSIGPSDFWSSLVFYLPALLQNVAVYLLAALFGRRQVPLDLGQGLGGKRLIGNSRGLISLPLALALGALVGGLQGRVLEAIHLTVGVDLGTVINSALKRRLGIPPGGRFFPLDQLDFILGASLVYALSYPLPLKVFLCGLVVGAAIHLFTNLFVRPNLEKRIVPNRGLGT
jgi:CDP-2,3-bis-(O-geranylgeranyl)-sn-glycerol synthase